MVNSGVPGFNFIVSLLFLYVLSICSTELDSSIASLLLMLSLVDGLLVHFVQDDSWLTAVVGFMLIQTDEPERLENVALALANFIASSPPRSSTDLFQSPGMLNSSLAMLFLIADIEILDFFDRMLQRESRRSSTFSSLCAALLELLKPTSIFIANRAQIKSLDSCYRSIKAAVEEAGRDGADDHMRQLLKEIPRLLHADRTKK